MAYLLAAVHALEEVHVDGNADVLGAGTGCPAGASAAHEHLGEGAGEGGLVEAHVPEAVEAAEEVLAVVPGLAVRRPRLVVHLPLALVREDLEGAKFQPSYLETSVKRSLASWAEFLSGWYCCAKR